MDPKTDRSPRLNTSHHISSQSPAHTYSQIDSTYPLSPPNNRLQTLRIFQQRSEVVIPSKTDGIRGLNGQIKHSDNMVTINALIKEGKKEYTKKKKPPVKGTMYVNDLWAQGYQREVVKQARIEADLENEKKISNQIIKKQISTIAKGGHDLPDALKVDALIQKNADLSRSSTMSDSSLSHQSIQNIKSPYLEPLRISGQDEDQYGLKPAVQAVQGDSHRNVSRRSRVLSQSGQVGKLQVRTEPSPGKSTNASFTHLAKNANNTNIHINLNTANMDEMRVTKHNSGGSGYSRGMMGHDNYSHSHHNEQSQYGLTPKSLARDIGTSTSRSRHVYTSMRRDVKKNYKEGSFAEYDKTSSREASAEHKSASLGREIESHKTKQFLEGTNHQVNELIGYCEEELCERENWVKLIHDLKGLFLTEKYDKGKKDEYQQKMKLIADCKLLLTKRNQHRWGPF